MTDKIAELKAALAGLKAALEGMERMLDEKLKMLLAFVEFLKKQDKKNKKRGRRI
jgi:hypothetical protein